MRQKTCRVFRLYTASKAMTIWNTLENSLVTIRVFYELRVDLLRKNENSEVNLHLPGSCSSIVARAKTRLMKAYEELAFNRQVDNGLDDHGQYIEPTVQRVWEDLYSMLD